MFLKFGLRTNANCLPDHSAICENVERNSILVATGIDFFLSSTIPASTLRNRPQQTVLQQTSVIHKSKLVDAQTLIDHSSLTVMNSY